MSIVESPNTRSEFKNLIKYNKDKVIFVKYTADWCGPCKSINDELLRLYSNFKGKKIMIIVDIDSKPDIASYMKINSIPTIQRYIDGYPDKVVIKADIEEIKQLFI